MEKFRAYVINLDRRADRWRQVRPQLDKLSTVVDVARMPAIEDSTYPHRGCTRSHMSIVALARKKRWPMVMVLEDDIVLTDPVGTIELLEFLQARKNWDVCFGGVSACRTESWTKMTGQVTSRPLVYKNISERLMEIPVSLSTMMVVYNHTSYDTVLSVNESDPKVYIDVFLSENIARKWVHVPFLAYQRAGYSDIAEDHINSRECYEQSESFLLELKRISGFRNQGI